MVYEVRVRQQECQGSCEEGRVMGTVAEVLRIHTIQYTLKVFLSHRWSSCSRTCGGGIRRSMRECDNPTPANGGLYCLGDRLRYESCNTKDCHKAVDFRLEQCKVFDGNNFQIADLPPWVQWVPHYRGSKHHHSPHHLLKPIPQLQRKTSASCTAGWNIPALISS